MVGCLTFYGLSIVNSHAIFFSRTSYSKQQRIFLVIVIFIWLFTIEYLRLHYQSTSTDRTLYVLLYYSQGTPAVNLGRAAQHFLVRHRHTIVFHFHCLRRGWQFSNFEQEHRELNIWCAFGGTLFSPTPFVRAFHLRLHEFRWFVGSISTAPYSSLEHVVVSCGISTFFSRASDEAI